INSANTAVVPGSCRWTSNDPWNVEVLEQTGVSSCLVRANKLPSVSKVILECTYSYNIYNPLTNVITRVASASAFCYVQVEESVTPTISTTPTTPATPVYPTYPISTQPAKCSHTSTKTIGAKKATYFAEGNTGYKICENCKTVVEDSKTIPVKVLKPPKVTVKGTEKAIKVTYNKVKGAKGFKVTYKIGKKTYNKKFTLTKKELKKAKVTKTIKVKKSGNYKVSVKAFVTSGKKIAYSKATKATIVKCKSNNSNNNKSKVCKINGTNCNVGDTITVALNMKTPKVLINFQGYTDFDTSYLKFVSAKINVNGGLINCVNNSILYNGVNISKGYDFTTTGTLYTATFKVKKAGSTTIKNTMQVMSDMNMTDVKESDCKISVKVSS
ncbi:MAG: hypothetical protein ACI4Q8_07805, partial [Ruminococcus sp.]